MKILKIFTLISAAALFSCSDDESAVTVSTDESAEAIASGMSSDNAGFTLQISDASSITTESIENSEAENGRTQACGQLLETSFIITNPVGSVNTYSFSITYGYELVCNPSPNTLNFTLDTEGTFIGSRIESVGSSQGDWTMTGLTSPTYYTLNGLYTRSETYVSKVGNKNTFTAEQEFTLSNIQVNKTTDLIESGSATVTISGASTNGTTFSHTGTLTFESNGVAILEINDNSYHIDIKTGSVIKL